MTNEEFQKRMQDLAEADKKVTQTEQMVAKSKVDWARQMARLRAAMDRLEGRNGESRH